MIPLLAAALNGRPVTSKNTTYTCTSTQICELQIAGLSFTGPEEDASGLCATTPACVGYALEDDKWHMCSSPTIHTNGSPNQKVRETQRACKDWHQNLLWRVSPL